MNRLMLLLPALLSSLPIAGCGADGAGGERLARASAPAIGKTDAGDVADHSCQVVLRAAGRQPAADFSDYETDCGSGECYYVWRGTIDVDENVADADGVFVLYHLASDPGWWQVPATPSDNVSPGYASYDFAISDHLFGPQDQAGDRLSIELVAFYRRADGSRVFDHNTQPGDFDNTVLDQADYFAAGDQGICRPPIGIISFFQSWTSYLGGNLRQGGYLQIEYDLARLPECRDSVDGSPAWDTVAHVRFLPSGQEFSGSVRRFAADGQPQQRPLVEKIPADAEQIEIWFENFADSGSGCKSWDSDYGNNYHFDVWPPADDPRCRNVESDDGGHYEDYRMAHNKPYCLAYEVSENYDAGNCEFYLNGIGLGNMGHYGIPYDWLLAYLRVGQQDGELLNVGLYTRYHDADGQPGERFSLGVEESPGLWRLGFTYLTAQMQGNPGIDYDIDQFAFFVDVRRPSGELVRLWQSNAGQNYGMDDAFSLPTQTEYIPYGNIQWSDQASAVFDSGRACH